MYLIIDSKNLVAEISQHPCYVRRQSNGVVILSDKQHADAIYSDDSDTFYPLEKMGYLCENYHFIEVDSVPPEVVPGYYYYHAGEFYTTEKNLTALARDKSPDIASIIFVSMAENGTLDDTTISEHAEQFNVWAYPASYAQGAICKHDNKIYRCLQAHTSQEDWKPGIAPSLWKEIGNPNAEWKEWSQPIGAIDTYAVGDKVSHNNKHWVSSQNNNIWEPGIYGWEEITKEG